MDEKLFGFVQAELRETLAHDRAMLMASVEGGTAQP